jgi:hypothetical protein
MLFQNDHEIVEKLMNNNLIDVYGNQISNEDSVQ